MIWRGVQLSIIDGGFLAMPKFCSRLAVLTSFLYPFVRTLFYYELPLPQTEKESGRTIVDGYHGDTLDHPIDNRIPIDKKARKTMLESR